MNPSSEQLRTQILDLVEQYYEAAFAEPDFSPGESPVPVSGKVFDAEDLRFLVDSSLDFWLTAGRFAREFEVEFAKIMGVRHSLLVNSGSSANLVALTALTSPTLGGRQLKPGDEVITVASGFPTTINPIIQNSLVPVFLDVTVPTYNIDVTMLDAALSAKTKAIMVAHTLGNPFDLDAVVPFARKHNLWLIEDCCDAVGSTYNGRQVGTFGDIATTSFYPAHHITMGEGGAVLTSNLQLKKLVESFRDWGRDCWCEPGKDNTCGKRFEWKLGELPAGYDHKYTYSHIGYNLKVTDMQAAVGVSQLKKLPAFIEARRRNFRLLSEGLKPYEEQLILPEATPNSAPSWFGFPIGVRPEAKINRDQLTQYLVDRKIGTRLLFGGNMVRQPAYMDVTHRTVGSLENSDFVMTNVFWIGVYPGLTEEMIKYILSTVGNFIENRNDE